MFFEFFAIGAGGMAAFAGYYFGLEIAMDWLYCWHLDYVKQLKPITDAYKRFKQLHSDTETKEGGS